MEAQGILKMPMLRCVHRHLSAPHHDQDAAAVAAAAENLIRAQYSTARRKVLSISSFRRTVCTSRQLTSHDSHSHQAPSFLLPASHPKNGAVDESEVFGLMCLCVCMMQRRAAIPIDQRYDRPNRKAIATNLESKKRSELPVTASHFGLTVPPTRLVAVFDVKTRDHLLSHIVVTVRPKSCENPSVICPIFRSNSFN